MPEISIPSSPPCAGAVRFPFPGVVLSFAIKLKSH